MFRFIFVLLLSSSLLSAQEILERRISDLTDMYASYELYQYEKSVSEWNQYKIDECNLRDHNVLNENELRDHGLRRCRDGSVSFIQPNSDGWNGWEGKCGQTAAANGLFHFCRVAKDPDSYIDDHLSDLTPGVRPRTLKKGLNKIFKKFENCSNIQFDEDNYRSINDFVGFVKQRIIPNMSHPMMITLNRNGVSRLRQPVIVLVQNPGTKYLHWVTVIDQVDKNSQCNFIVNHWDDQYMVPCNDLAKWSENVGRTYPVILRSLSTVFPKL